MGVVLSGEIANQLTLFDPQKTNNEPRQISNVCRDCCYVRSYVV